MKQLREPKPAPTLTGPLDLETQSGFMRAAGLQLEVVRPDEVSGWIQLDATQHQPWGLVHGGVYTTAIESAASVGASAAVAEHGQVAVGVNNNTNFVRSVSSGRVDVTARPIQQGRAQQLWEARITDHDGRLVATGQVRLQNISQRS